MKLILFFLAWDLKFGIWSSEFCTLGVQVWDSVLGFDVCCLGFGILELGF